MQLPRLTSLAFALYFSLLVAGNRAQLSPKGSRLAESLGLLLGLPLDLDMRSDSSNTAPSFLMKIYNCWSALGSSEDRSQCLTDVPESTPRGVLEDVNVVRSIRGTVLQDQSQAVFSHNLDPLPSSLTVNYNMSMMRRTKENIRYAFIRIPKRALTTDELVSIKGQCDVDSGLQLQLYVQVNTTNGSQDVMSLESTTKLSGQDIGEEKWVEFSDITHRFEEWLEESVTLTDFEVAHTRIIVGSGDCYNHLNPTELGFGETTKGGPYIVVFAKSDDSEEAIIKAGLTELAAEATANRNKRQVDSAQSENSGDTTLPLPSFNTSLYSDPCRLYSHSISFAELGWSDYILQPESYEANFCAGTCKFPLDSHYNTTKHSYIQSLASKLNPDLVPPPCCAPHRLQPVTVIYEQAPDTYVTHEWKDMRAESCGCK